ncbi:DUF1684 domain-containing protein [bacterium]|nr:DUF1684 domain-containing protein [Flavobacteriaceae bacterium]MDC0092607.1 DUF1684 domain-containing protein [bacterium]
MKTLLTIGLALMGIIFLGCQSQKKIIKFESEFQSEQNSFFKDASKSPLKSKDLKVFEGLDFFSIDSMFVVKAQLKRTPNTSYFEMKTTTNRVTRERVFGVLSFTINGQLLKLNVYQSEPDMDSDTDLDYLFLPFLDATNGETTYGGGRYIDLSIPATDALIIDFNKAYNPYCAYNEKYSCPIVPRENYLALEIRAGVKRFKDH